MSVPLSGRDVSPAARPTGRAQHVYGFCHQHGFCPLRKERVRLDQEMTAKFEFVPVDQFCRIFYRNVPADSFPSMTGSVAKDLFTRIKARTNEKDVQSDFCEIVNDNDLIPGFRIAECENLHDLNDLSKTKVDAGVFKVGDVPTDGRPNYWRQKMPFEFKFYTDILGAQDPNSVPARATRGQLMSYAELIMWLQHRTHLFMPLVFGQQARMFYWDRSGVVATEPFSYVEHPELMCDLLYGFSQLSEADQGLDPTVTLVTPDMPEYDTMTFQASLEQFPLDVDVQPGIALPAGTNINTAILSHTRRMFAESIKEEGVEFEGQVLPSSAVWPRWMVSVPDDVRGERKYLVGLPFFAATGVIGRATRCYVAWDIVDKCFVLLKDAWRALYARMEREGEILKTLNDKGVRNVPTVLRHADLPGQQTRCPLIWEERRKAETQKAAAKEESKDAETKDSNVPTQVAGAQTAARSGTIEPSPTGKHSKTASASRSAVTTPTAPQPPVSLPGTKRPREEDRKPEPERPPHGAEYHPFRDENGCPFRKHQHYRLVIKEIGIPLREIRTLQQLVEVIFDCTIAHKDAYLKACLVHRDLSMGNVLILPKIEAGKGEEPARVWWYGLLADWEVAKHVGTKEARQPERTATWQFTSVACMGDPTKDVEIPDELESLFNILLRAAVERGVSNCRNIPTFIESYFDDFYPCQGGRFIAPDKRGITMRVGRLLCGPDTDLKFYPKAATHPLNSIITNLLPVFKARYKVYDHSCANAAASTAPATSDSSLQQPPASPAPPERQLPEEPGEEELMDIPEEEPAPGPTTTDVELAHQLDTHDFFFKLLKTHIKTRRWPTDDVIKGEICLDDYVPAHADGEPPSKRQKSERQRRAASKGQQIKSPYGSFSMKS